MGPVVGGEEVELEVGDVVSGSSGLDSHTTLGKQYVSGGHGSSPSLHVGAQSHIISSSSTYCAQ